MIFGKIEYLNLLPFHVFMRRYAKGSQQRQILEYKKGVPSKINADFKSRRIDAAFISSIASKKRAATSVGILSRKEVKSVLLIPGEHESDHESATSNILAQVLNQRGKVLIGDKALKHFLEHDDSAIDLAQLWYQKHKLPFVFARLCYHGNNKKYNRLSQRFLSSSHKVPFYLLMKASKRTEIDPKDIVDYLKLIEYKIDKKAELSLKRFLRLAHRIT